MSEIVDALRDCIASLEGYRRNCRCDENSPDLPCDAEKKAAELLRKLEQGSQP